MVSLQARFSLVSGVKLSIVTQSAISWLNALTHRKKGLADSHIKW